jgi:hypothetical protein
MGGCLMSSYNGAGSDMDGIDRSASPARWPGLIILCYLEKLYEQP